jgi:hypothetical protein
MRSFRPFPSPAQIFGSPHSPSHHPATGAHFNQTLDLATATVFIELGTVRMSVWVDANADVVRVTADGPTPFSITVISTSTRPTSPWSHTPGFFCNAAVSNPDVYIDPLPQVNCTLLGSTPSVSACAITHLPPPPPPLPPLPSLPPSHTPTHLQTRTIFRNIYLHTAPKNLLVVQML